MKKAAIAALLCGGAFVSSSEHRRHCFRGFLACSVLSLPQDFSRPVWGHSLICAHFVQSSTLSGVDALISDLSDSEAHKTYYRALFGPLPGDPDDLEPRWSALLSLMSHEAPGLARGIVVAPSELISRDCLALCERQLRHRQRDADYHVPWLGESARGVRGLTMMEAIEAAAARAESELRPIGAPEEGGRGAGDAGAPPPLPRADALALAQFLRGMADLARLSRANGRAVALEGEFEREFPLLWAHLSAEVFGAEASLVPWGGSRAHDVPLLADPGNRHGVGVVVFGRAERAQPFVEFLHHARTNRQFREDAIEWIREMF